jgi:thioredoxin-dependent peroxiredoxin
MSLKEGDMAPPFEAATDDGRRVQLADYRGKDLVLYFYPKDDTPGCTAQACSFRDHLSEFTKKNAVILGVSVDTAESHRAFKKKYALPFTLLADPDAAISKAYGVFNEARGSASRWTFVVGPDGRIRKIFPQVKVEGHSDEVMAVLR